jgi:O-antigen/teichoic acid export membrane protein
MRYPIPTARPTVLYAGGRFVPAALTLLVTPLLARLLEPSAYGDLSLALSINGALAAGLFGWCEPIAVRELASTGDTHDGETATEAFGRTAAGTFTAISVVAIIAALIAHIMSDMPWLTLVTVSILFGASSFLIGIARAEGKPVPFFLVSLLANGGRSIAGIVVGFVSFTISSYFWGWGLFLGVALAVGYLSLGLRRERFLPIQLPSRSFLLYIVPVAGVAFSTLLLQVIDRIALDRVVDRASIGIYALGYSMTETGVVVVFSILHSRLFPLLLIHWSSDRIRAKRSLMRNAYISATIPLAMTPFLSILGSELLGIFGGREFQSASPWFMVAVAVGIAFYGVGQWLSVDLQHGRNSLRWFTATFTGVIINGLVILLIGSRTGILAGGIATIAAYATMTLLILVLSRERELWRIAWRSLLLPLLAASVGISVAIVIGQQSACVGAIAGTAVFAAIVILPHRPHLKEHIEAILAQ